MKLLLWPIHGQMWPEVFDDQVNFWASHCTMGMALAMTVLLDTQLDSSQLYITCVRQALLKTLVLFIKGKIKTLWEA